MKKQRKQKLLPSLKFRLDKKRGFTLVELMIVIFIFIMTISISLASFGNSKAIDEVQAASRKISSLLQEAQNNSLTGREQIISGALTGVCDNGIQISTSGNSATVTSNYLTRPSCAAPAIAEKTSSMANINVSMLSTDRISFAIPTGMATFPGGGDEYLITITSTRNNSVKAAVCVYRTGAIREFYPEVAVCP